MHENESRAVEERLGVRLPDDCRAWLPTLETSFVRGVAELLQPAKWDWWDWSTPDCVVVGTTTNGLPIVLRRTKGAKKLKNGVYEFDNEAGRFRLLVDRFSDLLLRETKRAPQTDRFEELATWADYLTGHLRICGACEREVAVLHSCLECGRAAEPSDRAVSRTEQELAAAALRFPNLFSAVEVAQEIGKGRLRALSDTTEIRVLEAAKSSKGSPQEKLDQLLARWSDVYGFERNEIPCERLLRFLAEP
jgi:hypothetical protein